MLLSRIKIFILVNFFPIVACSTMGKKAYGYKELNLLNEYKTKKWSTKIKNLHPYKIGFVDTSFTQNILLVSKNPMYQKAMAQFIVVMAFDSGYCRSIKSNCYFGGFPNIKWNDGTFDEFPFSSAFPDTICGQIYMEKVIRSTNIVDSIDYYAKSIVVLCGNTFYRQSRRMINLISKKYPEINIFILNNDNYIYFLMENPNIFRSCFLLNKGWNSDHFITKNDFNNFFKF